jgi:hypothetical protein
VQRGSGAKLLDRGSLAATHHNKTGNGTDAVIDDDDQNARNETMRTSQGGVSEDKRGEYNLQ